MGMQTTIIGGCIDCIDGIDCIVCIDCIIGIDCTILAGITQFMLFMLFMFSMLPIERASTNWMHHTTKCVCVCLFVWACRITSTCPLADTLATSSTLFTFHNLNLAVLRSSGIHNVHEAALPNHLAAVATKRSTSACWAHLGKFRIRELKADSSWTKHERVLFSVYFSHDECSYHCAILRNRISRKSALLVKTHFRCGLAPLSLPMAQTAQASPTEG